MYKYSKRNSYRRKPKSYKKYGSSKRFSRRKSYISTGSTSRVFHTVQILNDTITNSDGSGNNISQFGAYRILRNNDTFQQYCRLFEQFKVTGMTVQLSNLGGTDYSTKNNVVIKYVSMIDRNGQSTDRYKTFLDIESLQNAKSGYWTYGGRCTAYESVFARTLQEKSRYVATDDFLKIVQNSDASVFHTLNDEWDPNFLFSLLGPVSSKLNVNLDVRLYVSFRSAREVVSTTKVVPVTPLTLPVIYVDTVKVDTVSVSFSNFLTQDSSGGPPSYSPIQIDPGTSLVWVELNNVDGCYLIHFKNNNSSQIQVANMDPGVRYRHFSVQGDAQLYSGSKFVCGVGDPNSDNLDSSMSISNSIVQFV